MVPHKQWINNQCSGSLACRRRDCSRQWQRGGELQLNAHQICQYELTTITSPTERIWALRNEFQLAWANQVGWYFYSVVPSQILPNPINFLLDYCIIKLLLLYRLLLQLLMFVMVSVEFIALCPVNWFLVHIQSFGYMDIGNPSEEGQWTCVRECRAK